MDEQELDRVLADYTQRVIALMRRIQEYGIQAEVFRSVVKLMEEPGTFMDGTTATSAFLALTGTGSIEYARRRGGIHS
jgi:hypothetical protein